MRHPPVHPDGVVDLVADIRMGLLHRLGIGVDAAVPASPTRGDAGSRGSTPPRRSARVEAAATWVRPRSMLSLDRREQDAAASASSGTGKFEGNRKRVLLAGLIVIYAAVEFGSDLSHDVVRLSANNC